MKKILLLITLLVTFSVTFSQLPYDDVYYRAGDIGITQKVTNINSMCMIYTSYMFYYPTYHSSFYYGWNHHPYHWYNYNLFYYGWNHYPWYFMTPHKGGYYGGNHQYGYQQPKRYYGPRESSYGSRITTKKENTTPRYKKPVKRTPKPYYNKSTKSIDHIRVRTKNIIREVKFKEPRTSPTRQRYNYQRQFPTKQRYTSPQRQAPTKQRSNSQSRKR